MSYDGSKIMIWISLLVDCIGIIW